MKITVDIIRDNKNWLKHKTINKTLVKDVIKKIIDYFPGLQTIKIVEIAILLTDDEKMKELNTEFRKKNKPTNVLSFPDMIDDYKKVLEFKISSDYIRLGDLAFGYNVIEKEATEQKKSFYDHFVHLLVHGILHLIGLDHEINEEEAHIMEKTEIEILRYFSIDTPY